MSGHLSRLFDSANFLEDFLEVVIASEMDWKANRLAVEDDFNARFSNAFALRFHGLQHLFNEVIYGQGLQSHDNAAFKVSLCQSFQSLVFEDEADWNSILISCLVFNGLIR